MVTGNRFEAMITNFFESSSAGKNGKKNCTVVLATVNQGSIPNNHYPVYLNANYKTFSVDTVRCIQINGQPVSSANADDNVGLCLATTTVKQINAALK